jgi:hypothetical protein
LIKGLVLADMSHNIDIAEKPLYVFVVWADLHDVDLLAIVDL